MDKKLRKIIREAYIKAILKENMKESLEKIFEEDKEFYEEVKNIMLDATEAPVETPVKPDTDKPVTPSKRPAPVDPRKIPNPGIETKPKAEIKELSEKEYKLLETFSRFKQLIKEDAMTFPDDSRERPHPETKKRLEKRGDSKSTPFSDIEIFSREKEGQTTQEKIASKEFSEILKQVERVGKMTGGLKEKFGVAKLISDLEKPKKTQLINLAKKIIKKEFSLSDDIINKISADLVDPKEGSGQIGNFKKETRSNVVNSLTDEEKSILGGEIKIRKIMNAMMMGGGYKLFDFLNDFKSDLNSIDPRLYPLYAKFIPNANLDLWTQMSPIDLGLRIPAGSVQLKLDEENPSESKIVAKAFNFPVLIHEIAKGVLEYVFSIRLKNFSENLRKAIVDAADSYEEEHFMKILGPQIWKQVFYAIEVALDEYEQENELYGVENKREFLLLFINKMATMSAEDFNNLIDDLLNPGQAEESGREEPLQRIKNVIDNINTSIKEFLDSQNEETAEEAIFDLGQDNTQNITSSARENMDDWVEDLETKLNNQEEVNEEDLNSLSIEELTEKLNSALEEENYELAAKIRDIISSK